MNLTAQEARRRLADAAVARLATVTEAGRPHIVPITFAVDGDVIYTAVDAKPKTTVTGLRRLRNIRGQPQVAVLADHYADDWAGLWWARADGAAAILEDQGQTAAPVALLAARYPQYQDRLPGGPVIAIRVTRWTGWAASERAGA
jgi:PPOX class probable F420-dependent enzyme